MARTRRTSRAAATAIWAASATLTAAAMPRAAFAQPAAPPPPATAPATAPAPDVPPAERAAAELRQLAEILEAPDLDRTPRRFSRDEAARRLAQRGPIGADEVFARVINAPNGREAKLAALRGLATHPNPPATLIQPIANLLSDKLLNEAGAEALAAYKGNADALARLTAFAQNPAETLVPRAVVTRAIGTIPEPKAAAALVALLGDREKVIRDAAGNALADLTGRRDLGRDPIRWREWFKQNAGRPPAEWKADVLHARAAAQDELRRRNQELLGELSARLAQQYNQAAPAQRQPVLLDFLKSNVADVRARGADMLGEGFVQGGVTANDALRDRLIELVGDSSRDVRLETTLTLYLLNEFAAYDALLTQLPIEQDESTRAAQLRLLGRLETHARKPDKRIRSIGLLRELLRDPSLVVARAAADTIRVVGPVLRQEQPAVAADVADDLMLLIDNENVRAQPEAADLRETSIEALATLRHPGMLNFGRRLLNNGESRAARRAALRGLGELGNRNAADMIVDWLGQEREPSVRLDALVALSRVGGLEYADTFLRFMDPKEEREETVRDSARAAFLSLLPTASEQQLARLARGFRTDRDREMRVAILQALAARLEERGDVDNLALQRQTIGDDLLKLGRPADAVPFLQKAMDYFEKQGAGGVVTETLIGQLLDAHLKARQYAEAAAFGARTLSRDPSQQGTVGPKLKQEADRLQEAGRVDDAIALVDAALGMNPPLVPRYTAQLREIREQAAKRKAGAAATPPPP